MKKNALVDNALPPLVCISMLMALAAALLYAPTEKVMGDTQRIFYFHVPAAVSAFTCFFLVLAVCMPFAWLTRIPADLQDCGHSLAASAAFVSNFSMQTL